MNAPPRESLLAPVVPGAARWSALGVLLAAAVALAAGCADGAPVDRSDATDATNGDTVDDDYDTYEPDDTGSPEDTGRDRDTGRDVGADTTPPDDAGDGGSDADASTGVANLEIQPAGPVSVGHEKTKTLEAKTYDASGTPHPCGATIQWSSMDPSVATVTARSSDPRRADLTGKSVASTTVEASCGSVSASITVEVEAALPMRLTDPSKLAFWLKPGGIEPKSQSAPYVSVERWRDASGNKFHMEAGNSNYPGYVTGALKAYDAVRFSGGDENLDPNNRSTTYVKSPTVTLFFVTKNRAGNHTGQLLSACGIKAPGDHNNQIRFDGGPKKLYVHASDYYRDHYFSNLAMDTTQWHALTVVLGSSRLAVRQNGKAAGSTTVSSTQKGNWEFNQIGERCSSEKLDADLAEVLVYETELSKSDYERVETYLMNKYGF